MLRPRKLYVASHNRENAQSVRDQLLRAGHQPICQWVDRAEEWDRGWQALTQKEKYAVVYRDLHDLERAVDGLVLLAGPSDKSWSGGKHVELGYCLALRRPVWVVGEAENVFHFHDEVKVLSSVEALLDALALPD